MLTSDLRFELEKTNAMFARWLNQQKDWLQSSENEYHRILEECDSTAQVSCHAATIIGRSTQIPQLPPSPSSLLLSPLSLTWIRCSSSHTTAIGSMQPTLQALVETDRQLEASRPINDAIKATQKKEIDQYLSHTEHLHRTVRTLEQTLTDRCLEEERALSAHKEAKHEHDVKKSKLEQALKDLTHGTKFYAQLGLDFQKAEGDRMKFVFSQIHPYKTIACHFLLFVDHNNLYQLVETVPALDANQLAQLCARLNETNDIAVFVFQMRRLFQQFVQTARV